MGLDLEKTLLERSLRPVYIDISSRELVWLDVSRIPWEERWNRSRDIERIARAIETLEIRGAPAIGVAVALALAVEALNTSVRDPRELYRALERAAERLSRTRPTAVNLFWAIERMLEKARGLLERGVDTETFREEVLREALRIQEEDLLANIMIGRYGSVLIEDGDTVLTHCNTGSLATAGFGTALGVIRYAWAQGKRIEVVATETRPLLQGARLTVWELHREGIPVKLVSDNMVGYLMRRGVIDKVIVGADRILRTGHVVNKIGTYSIAVLASYHKIPFYVAAPTSSIDMKTDPENVVIEERDPDEVRTVMGRLYITVRDVEVLNPAFDMTPPELVTAIVTEKGIVKPPYETGLRRIVETS